MKKTQTENKKTLRNAKIKGLTLESAFDRFGGVNAYMRKSSPSSKSDTFNTAAQRSVDIMFVPSMGRPACGLWMGTTCRRVVAHPTFTRFSTLSAVYLGILSTPWESPWPQLLHQMF